METTIGYLVWWNLRGARVPHEELRQRLDAAMFPLPLKPPTPKVLNERARSAWRVQHPASRLQPTEDELAPLRESYRNMHIANDLIQAIRQIAEHIPGTISVRLDGGLLFAPPEAHGALVRLQRAFSGLPTVDQYVPSLYIVGQADDDETRTNLGAAVVTGLLQDVVRLHHDLTHLQSKAQVVALQTLEQRQSKAQAVLGRAALHSRLLTQTQQETIGAAVQALEKRLIEMGLKQ